MQPYYGVREYGRSGDAASIVALYARMAAQDATIDPITSEDWAHFLRLPQNKQGKDFRLAVLHGESIIGVATSSLRDSAEDLRRHFRILVEPEHRRRGMGSALLKEIAELDPGSFGYLQTVCPDNWTTAAAFYTKRIFTIADCELEMSLTRPNIHHPESQNLWRIQRENVSKELSASLAEIHNQAYEGTRSFVRVSAQTFPDLLSERSQLWTARLAENVIGYCHIEEQETDRWLESIAVMREHRRRGVATALIEAALLHPSPDRHRLMRLSVSESNAAALASYRRVGFQIVRSSTRYVADRQELLRQMSAWGLHQNGGTAKEHL
ncbi:MAG: GNAT family N-acetyltransferase [Methylobacteriaceae bacterium]|nr:GNAT family N-acetyltransferase [Methylobacteriaceae bacterium]